MKRIRRSKNGFTLIELMTVVIIVGILAIVAIPLYRGQVARARASEGAALLGSVLTGERVYYAEYTTYTTNQDNLGIDTTGNKYFKTYDVTAASATGFTAETIGTGAASTIQVTMVYTNAAGATISYNYDYEE